MFIEALEGRQMFSVTVNAPTQSIGVDNNTFTQYASTLQGGDTSFNDKVAGDTLRNITKKIADTGQAIEQNVK